MARPVTMTARERYVEPLLFGAPDRVPFHPGGPRESTLRRWHAEGLAKGKGWFDVFCQGTIDGFVSRSFIKRCTQQIGAVVKFPVPKTVGRLSRLASDHRRFCCPP